MRTNLRKQWTKNIINAHETYINTKCYFQFILPTSFNQMFYSIFDLYKSRNTFLYFIFFNSSTFYIQNIWNTSSSMPYENNKPIICKRFHAYLQLMDLSLNSSQISARLFPLNHLTFRSFWLALPFLEELWRVQLRRMSHETDKKANPHTWDTTQKQNKYKKSLKGCARGQRQSSAQTLHNDFKWYKKWQPEWHATTTAQELLGPDLILLR